MNALDPLKLQRFIDGECSTDELKSLLSMAQDDPEHWQIISAALLENRIWQQQFQSEFEVSSNTTLLPAPLTAKGMGKESSHVPAVFGLEATTPTHDRPAHHQTSFSVNWLSMAACALLASMLGYVVGQNFSDPYLPAGLLDDRVATIDPARSPIPGPNSSPTPTPLPKITPASLRADYHLELPTDQTSDLGGEVPLYDVQSAEQWRQLNQPARDTFPLSPQLLRQIEANGFRVQLNVNFVSGTLEDGRTFVVPIRSISFTPGQ